MQKCDPESVLLVACGNTLRSDDGAGPVLGDRLVRRFGPGLGCLKVHQLTPELSLDLLGESVKDVVFLDVHQQGSKGYCTSVEILPVHPAAPGDLTGHHLSPSGLLAFARLFQQDLPKGWLLTVPGWSFEFGEQLSPGARDSLKRAEDCFYLWLQSRIDL